MLVTPASTRQWGKFKYVCRLVLQGLPTSQVFQSLLLEWQLQFTQQDMAPAKCMSFTSSPKYSEYTSFRMSFPFFSDCRLKLFCLQSKYISSSLSIRCWLSTEDHFIWVFLAPVVAVIVVSKDPFLCLAPRVEKTFVFTDVCMFYLNLMINFFDVFLHSRSFKITQNCVIHI